MARRSRGGGRGRAAAISAGVMVMTAVAWSGGAQPALAHEFTVALVTPTSGMAQGPDGKDVIDGFRLSVDQSPDVTHPPGAEGGDHLGGVDVDVNIIDGTEAAVAAQEVRQLLVTGLTTVVVIAADPAARAVAQELEGSPVVLVTAAGAGASAPSDAGDLRLTQRTAPLSRSAPAADLVAAFQREYGRDPSAAAALGYDAGRLLDTAVARADEGVEDLDSVVAAAAEVTLTDGLVSSDVTAPGQATRQRASSRDPAATADPSRGRLLPVAAAASTVLLVLVIGILGWHARNRREAAH